MNLLNEKGYLYIADGLRYVKEAELSAKSLKKHTKLPIALLTSEEYESDEFNFIIVDNNIKGKKFASKAIGIYKSPFTKTIFLDGDTFIVESIDNLFMPLELFDFGATIEKLIHTNMSESPKKDIFFYGVIPEFHTGILAIKKTINSDKLLLNWIELCVGSTEIADMPHFRTAFLNNPHINYFIIPDNYNCHGFNNYLMLYDKVKVIHERLGRKLNSITPYMLDNGKMEVFSRKINSKLIKRIYVPKIGIISYYWNLDYIIKRIKKIFGAGYHSKITGEFKKFKK